MSDSVPVIDLAPLFDGGDGEQAVAAAVADACCHWGFFQIVNHGVSDALVDGVIRDFEMNSDNDPVLAASYKVMLLDFAKDWREIWALHGYQESGWQQYQQAIDRVFGSLHKNPRALVTASNAVGVNPIIVQRILRAALAIDKLDQFVGALPGKS